MGVMEALNAHGDAGAAIVDLLYGDGAAEVSKAISEKRQGQIAAASNVVGIGAGLAAIPGAYTGFRDARANVRQTQGKPRKVAGALRPLGRLGRAGQRVGAQLKKPKTALALAGGGLALQAGNVGGDFVTNRVLARANKSEQIKKSAEHDIEWTGEISKMDTEKRQVFGWASVSSIDGVPVADLQGDEVDLEEIEKAAYAYVAKSRVGGNMHKRNDDDTPVHVSDLIESLVVTPEKAAALGISKSHEGWWCGFQVNDDETWEAAKKGELVMFSVHGKGRRS